MGGSVFAFLFFEPIFGFKFQALIKDLKFNLTLTVRKIRIRHLHSSLPCHVSFLPTSCLSFLSCHDDKELRAKPTRRQRLCFDLSYKRDRHKDSGTIVSCALCLDSVACYYYDVWNFRLRYVRSALDPQEDPGHFDPGSAPVGVPRLRQRRCCDRLGCRGFAR
jgi:hypothetical protein